MIRSLSPQEAEAFLFAWRVWARKEQVAPPGEWRTWLVKAGRGWGKTRTGAEWIGERVDAGFGRIALVGRTAADVRDVIVEGESGILATSPKHRRPKYQPSKRRVVWPNGATATCYSADEPDSLRGPQHDTAWGDELASWKYPDAWDQLQFGLRLGRDPRAIVTTTPRPTALIKALIADPTTVVTNGRTFDNRANLAQAFLEKIVAKYAGTRLGRQELDGEVLDDNPGALWKRDWIDLRRVIRAPKMRKIVISIDPAVTSNENSAESGIIAAGLGVDGHGYCLGDDSLIGSPNAWARAALTSYSKHEANVFVGEVNNGGDLVESNVTTAARAEKMLVSFEQVRASRGKATRAEPISSLSEQGNIHHVGVFPQLEDQLCDWDPLVSATSPDRLDAYVWAFTYLMIGPIVPIGVTKHTGLGGSYRLGTGRGYGS